MEKNRQTIGRSIRHHVEYMKINKDQMALLGVQAATIVVCAIYTHRKINQ